MGPMDGHIQVAPQLHPTAAYKLEKSQQILSPMVDHFISVPFTCNTLHSGKYTNRFYPCCNYSLIRIYSLSIMLLKHEVEA